MEGNDYVYRNPNAAVEDRIKDVLSRLSLNEKVGQMTQVERGVATPSALKDLAIGTYFPAFPSLTNFNFQINPGFNI